MSKAARLRKHEEEKAEKALGGASMIVVEGEEATSGKVDYVDLQWFRLLRGTQRLNQIATILVELAPSKVFDPRDIWIQHRKAEALINDAEAEPETKKMSGSQKKTMSKAEQIKQANAARLQKEAAKRDEEKLTTLRSKARADVKLETETGKLLLLLEILKTSVREQNVVDVLDTLWEVESVVKELGEDTETIRAIVKKHSDVIAMARTIRLDRDQLKKMNLVDFQLMEMSDRLPPLNLHSLSGKFKLDEWQIKVLSLIEERKSVLVTAPTSSGKTVLSSFVCTTGSRVLFVVPTEPLAWQVAAMLRALKLGIGLIVPTLTFVPPAWDVMVGTPHALESQLTKQVGFDFDYAVFDEVHSLNNRDGEALQRIILAMPTDTCRFLALSATIGNSQPLKAWFESILGKGQIELVEHRARFINLQRHVWVPSIKEGVESDLRQLHPLACVDVKFLAEHGFDHTDMAFTPVDCYKLWLAIDRHVVRDDAVSAKIDLSGLKPRKYFGDKDETTRITLAQASEYELVLKAKLEELAKVAPEACEKVLSALATGDLSKKKKKKKDSDAAGAADDDASDQKLNIVQEMEVSSHAANAASLVDLCFNLSKKQLTPCIMFQLDSVRCQELFDDFLKEIEEREAEAQPEYRSNLLRAQKGLEKQEKARAAKADKKQGNRKAGEDREDEGPDTTAQDFGEMSSASVDVDAPHAQFTLAPTGRGIGMSEAADIRAILRDDLPPIGDIPHPLVRALRRGVGVYIEGLPTSYHRVVQSLAQRGALGVVFADELLAYGVNMPFRAALFYGDPGRHWLTPLLHQQMAGRAGRRGLDRQGHLVYAGFTPDRLRELLRGELPDVVGRFPLYPTIPLQLEMNRRFVNKGKPLDEAKMHSICRTPLQEFLRGEKIEGYYEHALAWVDALGILKHPRSSYSYLVPEMVWELRHYLPESAAIQYILEPLAKKYRNAEVVKGDKDAPVQCAVFLIFCRICAREPLLEVNAEQPLPSWYGALPSPHVPDESWDEWSALIRQSQERITNSNLPYKEQLLLPVDLDAPLDNMCYSSFVRNQVDPALPTEMQHKLRARLWDVGEVLRIVSNVLGKSSELQSVQNLIRKCFIRIRYILEETFQRNWK